MTMNIWRRMLPALAGMMITFAAWSSLAQASHECETSCSARCLTLVDEWERIVEANRAYCDGTGPVDCVPRCVRRWSDGACREYGQDFCARDAQCVVKCATRWSDGTCREYAADFCGEAPVTCVERCTVRWSDGSCREYGEDHCGRRAECRATCTARYPDGSCKTWGADTCYP